MSKRVPAEAVVCGARYQVIRCPAEDIPDADSPLGLCDPQERKIYVATEIRGKKAWEVYRHEWWHAHIAESGVYEYLRHHFGEKHLVKHIEMIVELFEMGERRGA